ncbi:uncharacterized protein TNIN_67561 [Trichonephila inaurata madagascariensis]|uniref:Uncharacterized protein n=1 Tax=Trichonephila inaurata madagascariensis TaxID=2747483 RepID=A0A8X6MEG6_9ARAC|nr:uncharacterized protein TNIN_67561 [Trichonephila inaurata madagascariensis]
MGVPSIEERNTTTCCLSPKIYQAPEDEMDSQGFLRKKKMFSSSSFYEEPNCIYPTVQEQVKLCRKIAESLSDDCNLKSKGANMFFKRVKKAEKWIVAESNVKNEDENQDSNKDPTKMPYVRPGKDLPKLKLILAPRQIVDMKTLLREGVDIVEHNAVSPDICHDIVKDLNSPTGKGAQLFAKRKKKSCEWVVDEEKVRHLLQERYQISYPSPEPPSEPLIHPRVKALSEVNSQVIAESVIRAAEAKIMTYPNAVPHVPVIQSLNRIDSVDGSNLSLQTPVQSAAFNKSGPWTTDSLKYSIPKGWTGATTSSSTEPPKRPTSEIILDMDISQISTNNSLLSSPSSLRRSQSFRNFNTSPRAWNADIPNHFRPAAIKPIKPPSVLVQ